MSLIILLKHMRDETFPAIDHSKSTIQILNKHIIVNTGLHLFDKTRESMFEPTQYIIVCEM
jgi:hypothetical protein